MASAVGGATETNPPGSASNASRTMRSAAQRPVLTGTRNSTPQEIANCTGMSSVTKGATARLEIGAHGVTSPNCHAIRGAVAPQAASETGTARRR